MKQKVFKSRPWKIRYAHLLPYIKGKDVLDIGSAGGLEDDKPFLFEFISKHASSASGIDYNIKAVNHRIKQGYNIVLGNAETYNPHKKFDVITAYEVIEHVSNPLTFIKNIRRHLKKNGILIIETVNAYNIIGVTVTLLRGKYKICEEHVAIYDESCLSELLRRANLKPIKFDYYSSLHHGNASFLGEILIFLNYVISKFSKRTNSMILSISRR